MLHLASPWVSPASDCYPSTGFRGGLDTDAGASDVPGMGECWLSVRERTHRLNEHNVACVLLHRRHEGSPEGSGSTLQPRLAITTGHNIN